MKSSAILVAAVASLALGAPATVADKDHQLVFYAEINFEGRSESITAKDKVCTNLNRKVDDKVSSIRNEDKIKCQFYVDKDCGGKNFESSDDEDDLKKRFDDALSSFLCEFGKGTGQSETA